MQTDPCFSVKQHRGHVCTRKDDDNGQGKAILRHLGAILWRFGPISWPFCGALGPSHRHHHHLGAILCALGQSRSHVGAILRKRLDLILQGAHRSLKTNAFEAISGQSWCYFGAILGPSDSNFSRCAAHLENGPILGLPWGKMAQHSFRMAQNGPTKAPRWSQLGPKMAQKYQAPLP